MNPPPLPPPAGPGSAPPLSRAGRVVEERPEAPAGQVGGDGKAAEVGQRRVEVDVLDEPRRRLSRRLHARRGDDQADPGRLLEEALFCQRPCSPRW